MWMGITKITSGIIWLYYISTATTKFIQVCVTSIQLLRSRVRLTRAPWYARIELANSVGWSSRQLTSRRTTYLTSKEKGDKSLFVKREVTEDVYGTVPQRLSYMAKAKLPES
jgi:hypothetical protein